MPANTHPLRRLRDLIAGHRTVAVVVALFVLLATAYNLSNPLLESPDEELHYKFVYYLQHERKLPVVDPTGPLSQYHQGPLYYVIGALLTPPITPAQLQSLTVNNPFWGYAVTAVGRDNKNQFIHDPHRSPLASPDWKLRLLRFYSTLFGVGTLLLTYLLAREFLSEHLAVASMALVGFIPTFLLTSTSITNDALTVTLSALAGLIVVRLVGRDAPPAPRDWALLSVVLGLGLLAKISIYPVLPVVVLGVTLIAIRHKSLRLFVEAGVILALGVALVFGWWMVRNMRLYGDPTGLSALHEAWRPRHAFTLADLRANLPGWFATFWGVFGWGNVPMPNWVYTVLFIAVLISAGGLVVLAVRRGKDLLRASPQRDKALALIVWILLSFVALLYFMRTAYNVTGRHVYAILPALGVALVAGWSQWVPARHQRAFALVLGGTMAVFAALAWGLILAPAYSPGPRLDASQVDAVAAQRLDWQVGDVATLLGYSIAPQAADPGGTVRVTLVWQVLKQPDRNYVEYVHLLDATGAKVGSRETLPGLGNNPTEFWQPGEIVADTIAVPLNPDAQDPVLLDVVAGLYDPIAKADLPVRSPDGAPVDFPLIGQVKLNGTGPAMPQTATAVGTVFADGTTLEGYEVTPAQAAPGDTVTLTLYWGASGPLPADYTVFVHLVGADGAELATQGDGPPLGGRYPTTAWGAGETIRDVHSIPLPADLAPGVYTIRVGLYNPADGSRLPLAVGGDSLLLDAALTVR